MRFEGIGVVLRHRVHCVLYSNKGIDEKSVLRSGWCSCTALYSAVACSIKHFKCTETLTKINMGLGHRKIRRLS